MLLLRLRSPPRIVFFFIFSLTLESERIIIMSSIGRSTRTSANQEAAFDPCDP